MICFRFHKVKILNTITYCFGTFKKNHSQLYRTTVRPMFTERISVNRTELTQSSLLSLSNYRKSRETYRSQ